MKRWTPVLHRLLPEFDFALVCRGRKRRQKIQNQKQEREADRPRLLKSQVVEGKVWGRAEGHIRLWPNVGQTQEHCEAKAARCQLMLPCPGPHLPPAPLHSARQQHRSLYISAKFELMIGTVFVILHQAVLVSGIYLCYCFGSFFQGLFSSDMSGLQSKRNSEFTFTVRQAECYYPCICHQPADPSL